MALKSKEFAGDPKLEAAAVSHSEHIVKGASGQHVAKIQQALIKLDGAIIAATELAKSSYGESTANAVLAYKTKRGIINFAYQQKADNIVGKMTIAALDEELVKHPPGPPTPPTKPGVFFVTADVEPGQTYGGVLNSFGLNYAGQMQAIRDPHNAHLHGSLPDAALPLLLGVMVVTASTVVVPIDVTLTVLEFRPVIDMTGLVPTSPPTTHGVRVRIGRNLLAGTGLNWIQTVKKLNNPDSNAPQEFVDIGINNKPFFDFSQPPGVPAPREFFDEPSGPIAPAPGRGVDFTAMTTLAVLVRGHIILAAGKVWRYVITTARTLPDGVRTTPPPRDATAADFQNQLHILRIGQNNLRGPTGPHLDYVVRPPAGTVIT
jgi:hypothetical protein